MNQCGNCFLPSVAIGHRKGETKRSGRVGSFTLLALRCRGLTLGKSRTERAIQNVLPKIALARKRFRRTGTNHAGWQLPLLAGLLVQRQVIHL